PAMNPALVGFVPGVGTIRGVSVNGGVATVASDPFGVSTVNVTNPSMPTVMGSADEPFTGRDVAIVGTRAVVGGEANGLARLWVVDMTQPSHRIVKGALPTNVTVGTANGFLNVVMNSTGTLAVAAMGGPGLYVVDVSNPAAPVLRGSLDTSGVAYAVALNA